mmetsp:Transcript_124735/g.216235  ORF Transcript_124735/g.216235 Transcript_124735/m.216235 type:complete len:91 (-) Transcript_124735:1388-1660(-)
MAAASRVAALNSSPRACHSAFRSWFAEASPWSLDMISFRAEPAGPSDWFSGAAAGTASEGEEDLSQPAPAVTKLPDDEEALDDGRSHAGA